MFGDFECFLWFIVLLGVCFVAGFVICVYSFVLLVCFLLWVCAFYYLFVRLAMFAYLIMVSTWLLVFALRWILVFIACFNVFTECFVYL